MKRLLILMLPLLLFCTAFAKQPAHKAKKVRPQHGKARKIKPQRHSPMYTTAQARKVKPAKVARERANSANR